MAITLSSEDYNDLLQRANLGVAFADPPHNHAIQQVIPIQLGQGYIRQIQLQDIHLHLSNYQLHDDLYIIDRSEEEISSSYEFGFNLSGHRAGRGSGENFLDWGFYEQDEVECPYLTLSNEPIVKVDIHLETSAGLCQMISDALAELPKSIRRSIDTEYPNWLSHVDRITPTMRSVLEGILHCPFQGKIQQIYLEGQCLELIALKLEQLKEAQTYPKAFSVLKPDDIDRVYVARQLLTDNLGDPPSLMELARQVGLNDYKLKVGFREVFGTTVFGYLHRHRMEAARHLLNDRRLNVKEVAQAVGYTNQSRFAAAFRKQFGINPKAYLLNKRSG